VCRAFAEEQAQMEAATVLVTSFPPEIGLAVRGQSHSLSIQQSSKSSLSIARVGYIHENFVDFIATQRKYA